MARYTVSYKGILFDGDNAGWNFHDYDNFNDAISLYYFYGNMIEIKDNYYDVRFSNGEWY